MDDVNAGGVSSDNPSLNVTKKPKWLWAVVMMVLGILIGAIVLLLIWQPWAEEERYKEKPSGASNSTTTDTSDEAMAIAEDMRRTCSDKIVQNTEAPRIVQGKISTSSVMTDSDYLLICDWGIGIRMDDGLSIAFLAEAEKVGFAAITVDTEYYNHYGGQVDAPEFFSDIFALSIDRVLATVGAAKVFKVAMCYNT